MKRPPIYKWLSTFKVPIAPLPKFVVGRGPKYDGQFSYYETDKTRSDYDTVYLLSDIDLYSFAHEMGHVFDEKIFLPAHRELMKKWFKIKGGWFWGEMSQGPMEEGPEAGMEIFADAYSQAATGMFAKRARLRRFLKQVKKEYDHRTN